MNTKKLIINMVLFLASSIIPLLFYFLCCVDEVFITITILIFIFVIPLISTLLLLVTIFIKNKPNMQKSFAKLLLFNSFWWFVFFIILVPLAQDLHEKKLQESQKPYKNIVKELENYKFEHNAYPQNLSLLNIPEEQIPKDLHYALYNQNNDFMLEYKSGSDRYNIYCSNENINDSCKENDMGSIKIYKTEDNWLYYIYD